MSVVKTLTWAAQMLQMSAANRTKTKKLCLNHVRHFDKGEKTKAAVDFVNSLQKDFQFIGFTPNVFYLKEKGPKNDMNVLWVHPFSTPTLLYKHKRLPCLLMTNGNLEFNSSRLAKIKANIGIDELHNILGITG